MGQVATAKKMYRTRGIAGVMSAFKDRYLNNVIGRKLDWICGKAIEMSGNVVKIDGCTFSLNSPVITTANKSKFMFDQYEKPEREAVQRFLDPALPVVEFGGSIGVVSCLTNRRLQHPKRHIVVEANPMVVPLLQQNRKQNNCEFTVLPRVVGYGSDHVAFYVNKSNFVISSTVTSSEVGKDVEVHNIPTINLRSILDENQFERCTLICDIEGGESDLLRNEFDLFKDRVATIILEVHEWSLGKARVEELFQELSGLGFETVFSEGDTYVFQK